MQKKIDLDQYKIIEKTSYLDKKIGLMLQKLKDKEIALFSFKKEVDHNFHTFFMLQSIDMVFLNKNRRVVQYEQKIKPYQTIKAEEKYKYVIEANEGFIEKKNISLNDKISKS